MSRSGERDLITSDIGRGVELKLILQYEWLARNRESVTPGEARIKQAVWQWFSSLHGADLQRVFTVVDKSWLEVLLALDRIAQKKTKDGVFVPPISDELSSESSNMGYSAVVQAGYTGAAHVRATERVRRRSLQEYVKFKQCATSEAGLEWPLHRSYEHVTMLWHRDETNAERDQHLSLISQFRSASHALRAMVRVVDTRERCDTITIPLAQPEGLGNTGVSDVLALLANAAHSAASSAASSAADARGHDSSSGSSTPTINALLWQLLDHVSLGAFATAIPQREQLDRAGPTVATSWFAATGAYSVGSFIANRLELALLREFRAYAESTGILRTVLKGDDGSAAISAAPTWPNAPATASTSASAASASSASASGEGNVSSASATAAAGPSTATESARLGAGVQAGGSILTPTRTASSAGSTGSVTKLSNVAALPISSPGQKRKADDVSSPRGVQLPAASQSEEDSAARRRPDGSNALVSTPTGKGSGTPGSLPRRVYSSSSDGSGGSGLGLFIPSHFAALWDGLSLEDRWRIITGNGRDSTGRLPFPIPPVSLASHAAEDDGIGLPVGVDAVSPRSTLARGGGTPGKGSSHSRRSSRGNVTGSAGAGSSRSEAGPAADASPLLGGSGSTTAPPRLDLSELSSSDLLRSFPYDLLQQDGAAVVQRLYLRPLDLAASDADETARAVAFRLSTKGADELAMDLILAETASSEKRRKGGPVHGSAGAAAALSPEPSADSADKDKRGRAASFAGVSSGASTATDAAAAAPAPTSASSASATAMPKVTPPSPVRPTVYGSYAAAAAGRAGLAAARSAGDASADGGYRPGLAPAAAVTVDSADAALDSADNSSPDSSRRSSVAGFGGSSGAGGASDSGVAESWEQAGTRRDRRQQTRDKVLETSSTVSGSGRKGKGKSSGKAKSEPGAAMAPAPAAAALAPALQQAGSGKPLSASLPLSLGPAVRQQSAAAATAGPAAVSSTVSGRTDAQGRKRSTSSGQLGAPSATDAAAASTAATAGSKMSWARAVAPKMAVAPPPAPAVAAPVTLPSTTSAPVPLPVPAPAPAIAAPPVAAPAAAVSATKPAGNARSRSTSETGPSGNVPAFAPPAAAKAPAVQGSKTTVPAATATAPAPISAVAAPAAMAPAAVPAAAPGKSFGSWSSFAQSLRGPVPSTSAMPAAASFAATAAAADAAELSTPPTVTLPTSVSAPASPHRPAFGASGRKKGSAQLQGQGAGAAAAAEAAQKMEAVTSLAAAVAASSLPAAATVAPAAVPASAVAPGAGLKSRTASVDVGHSLQLPPPAAPLSSTEMQPELNDAAERTAVEDKTEPAIAAPAVTGLSILRRPNVQPATAAASGSSESVPQQVPSRVPADVPATATVPAVVPSPAPVETTTAPAPAAAAAPQTLGGRSRSYHRLPTTGMLSTTSNEAATSNASFPQQGQYAMQQQQLLPAYVQTQQRHQSFSGPFAGLSPSAAAAASFGSHPPPLPPPLPPQQPGQPQGPPLYPPAPGTPTAAQMQFQQPPAMQSAGGLSPQQREAYVEELLGLSPETGLPLWLEFQLHFELLKLQQWCVAQAHHRRMQELRLLWEIGKLVLDTIPSASVHVFGSFMTGLAIPSSDVDVLIQLNKHEDNFALGPGAGGKPASRHFQRLAQAIKSQAWATNVNAISTAHVPVIKITAEPPAWEPSPSSDPFPMRARQAAPPATVSTAASTATSGPGSATSTATGAEAAAEEQAVSRKPSLTVNSSGGDKSSDSLASTSTAGYISVAPPGSPSSSSSAARDPLSRSSRSTNASAVIQALTAAAPPSPASPRLPPRRGSVSGSIGSPGFLSLSRQNTSVTSSSNAPHDGGSVESNGDAAASGTGASAASASGSSSGSPAAPPALSRMELLASRGWFDASAPLRLDITFKSDIHRGYLTTCYTRHQLAVIPMLAPLTLACKLLLAGHGLNDAFSGGISSFGMLLLTQVYLQQLLRERYMFPGRAPMPPLVRQGFMPPAVSMFSDVPIQPFGDGRAFHTVIEPYATLPLELCGSLPSVASLPTPFPMPLLPPITPPHSLVHNQPPRSLVMVTKATYPSYPPPLPMQMPAPGLPGPLPHAMAPASVGGRSTASPSPSPSHNSAPPSRRTSVMNTEVPTAPASGTSPLPVAPQQPGAMPPAFIPLNVGDELHRNAAFIPYPFQPGHGGHGMPPAMTPAANSGMPLHHPMPTYPQALAQQPPIMTAPVGPAMPLQQSPLVQVDAATAGAAEGAAPIAAPPGLTTQLGPEGAQQATGEGSYLHIPAGLRPAPVVPPALVPGGLVADGSSTSSSSPAALGIRAPGSATASASSISSASSEQQQAGSGRSKRRNSRGKQQTAAAAMADGAFRPVLHPGVPFDFDSSSPSAAAAMAAAAAASLAFPPTMAGLLPPSGLPPRTSVPAQQQYGAGLHSAPATPLHGLLGHTAIHNLPPLPYATMQSVPVTMPAPVAAPLGVAAPLAPVSAAAAPSPALQSSPTASAASSPMAPSPTGSAAPAAAPVFVEGGDDPTLFRAPFVGRTFLNLLKYYGEEFNASTMCVDPVKSAIYPLISPGAGGGNNPHAAAAAAYNAGIVDPLTVPDPTDMKSNVGRNCFRFFQIQAVFRDARKALATWASEHQPPRERLQAMVDCSTPEAAHAAAAAVVAAATAAPPPLPAASNAESSSPNSAPTASAAPAPTIPAHVLRCGFLNVPSRSAMLPAAESCAPSSGSGSADLPSTEFPVLALILPILRGI